MIMKPISSKTRALVLAGLSLVLSCSSYPTDGVECPATVCSSHGTCSWQATFPTCACEPGYDGVVCGQCSAEFHRGADGTCLPDATCAAGACGDHGVCSVVEGRRVCACSPDTAGVDCGDCRAGYHHEQDAGCGLDTACTAATCANGGTCTADGGRVSCQCPDGTAGAFCEALTQSCAQANPCSMYGACLDQGGLVRCACDPGYAAWSCEHGTWTFAPSDVPAPEAAASEEEIRAALLASLDEATLRELLDAKTAPPPDAKPAPEAKPVKAAAPAAKA